MNFLMIFFKFDKSHWLRSYATKTEGKMVKKKLFFFADFEVKNYLTLKNYGSFGKVFFRPFRCRFQVEKILLG